MEFEQLVQQVCEYYGSPAAAVFGGVSVLSGVAIGNGVVLETPFWPRAVNASLGCLICAEQLDATWAAFEALSQPLRDEGDKRLYRRAAGAKEIRQQIKQIEGDRRAYFGSDVVRDASVDAQFQAKIAQLQAALSPLLVTENPDPASLEMDVLNSGGGGLVAMLQDAWFSRFVELAKRDASAFRFLAQVFEGKTPESSFSNRARQRSVIRPVVGSLLVCLPGTTARLVCSKDPVMREFADQLIMAQALPASSARCGSGPRAALTDFWPAWIAQMLALRDGGLRRRLRLSRIAIAALRSYVEEVAQLSSEQERWRKQAALKATKFALNLHVWGSSQQDEVTETTICAAIQANRWLTRETAAAACACAAAEEDRTLRQAAAVMLRKLKRLAEDLERPVTRRELYRAYDDESRVLNDPVLEFLLRTGQVRWVDEDRLESTAGPGEP